MMDDRNYMEDIGKNAAKKAGKTAGRIGARMVRKTGRNLKPLIKKAIISIGKFISALLIKTAPIWGPFVLILLLIWFVFTAIYAIPRQAAEDVILGKASEKDRVAAFYGFSEDDEFIEDNKDLFERYEKIADGWKEGLTEEQINQAQTHALSWAVLASVDRLANDPTIAGGKDIKIDPAGTEQALRPQFDWVQYTEVTVSESCSCRTETDEEGNEYEECSIDRTITKNPVTLLKKAYTIEGVFDYKYEEKIESRTSYSKCGVLTNTKTTMELVNVEGPSAEEYYQPLYNYLESRGITHEMDIELVLELIPIFDLNYAINYATLTNFGDIALLTGSNEWNWVTPSTTVTSHFGLRWGKDHNGVDIAPIRSRVNEDPLFAMESGTVALAVNGCPPNGYYGNRCGGGYGNQVLINYGNGLQTLYGHMQNVYVNQGDQIEKGDTIGTMGNSGSSTGTHLHFEVRLNGVPYDPVLYFNFLR